MKAALSLPGTVLYLVLIAAAGFMTYQSGPAVEEYLFPVARVDYLMPYNAAVSEAPVVRYRDHICWAWHLTKFRSLVTKWWSIVLVMPDGTRVFSGAIDDRTGHTYRSTDARNGGYSGISKICVQVPPEVSSLVPLQIESFAQYEPPHHLWLLDFAPPPIPVPPMMSEVTR